MTWLEYLESVKVLLKQYFLLGLIEFEGLHAMEKFHEENLGIEERLEMGYFEKFSVGDTGIDFGGYVELCLWKRKEKIFVTKSMFSL